MKTNAIVNCPCNAQKNYLDCCEPFITGKQKPETPEALMRSRYTAFTLAHIAYIKETMRAQALAGFQEMETKRWAKRVNWIKLSVIKASMANANKGYVEFEASFVDASRLKSIHEKSEFIYDDDRWFYIGGEHLPPSHSEQLVSRNSSCPCGSPRKFKNCHGA